MSLLLGTDPSRTKLAELLEKSPSGIVLSAFFSDAAEAWLRTKQIAKCQFVIRGQVQDFQSGVTSINAIKNLLTDGHQVKLRLDLHAKLFWFGDEMLVGSSNLTGNGFNLIERGGNIELNSVVPATSDNVAIVQNILKSAIELDIEILSKMEDFLATSVTENAELMNWPVNLFPDDHDKLSLPDLPMLDFQLSAQHDLELWGDIARNHLSGNLGKATNMIEATKVFDWLLLKIDEAGDRGLRFGSISSLLHDELYADPALFRSEVKELQQNLYSFLKVVHSKIDLSVPGARSEVLKRR
jgi:hypothetical protein